MFVAVEVSAKKAKKLKKDKFLKSVEPNYEMKAFAMPAAQEDVDANLRRLKEEIPWGIKVVLENQMDFFDKKDVEGPKKVCVADTGYGLGHKDLPSKKTDVDGKDSAELNEKWDVDQAQHGTHCAGTVAAKGDNNEGVVGVIPNNKNGNFQLLIGKALGSSGGGTASSVMKSVQGCVDQGAHVVSLSLGCDGCKTQTEEKFYENLYKTRNILLVAAAGNSGNSNLGYPASYPSIMSVGAVTQNLERSSFSQFNSQIEISAPGSGIKSTLPGNKYASWDGTSMATPHVAGVAGLLMMHFPSCKNYHIRNVLDKTAKSKTGCNKNLGYGVVQAKAAYDLLTKERCGGNLGSVDPIGGCNQLSPQPSPTPPRPKPTPRPNPKPTKNPTRNKPTKPTFDDNYNDNGGDDDYNYNDYGGYDDFQDFDDYFYDDDKNGGFDDDKNGGFDDDNRMDDYYYYDDDKYAYYDDGMYYDDDKYAYYDDGMYYDDDKYAYYDDGMYYDDDKNAYYDDGIYYDDDKYAYYDDGMYYDDDKNAYYDDGMYYDDDKNAYYDDGMYYDDDKYAYFDDGMYYDDDKYAYYDDGMFYDDDKYAYYDDGMYYDDGNWDDDWQNKKKNNKKKNNKKNKPNKKMKKKTKPGAQKKFKMKKGSEKKFTMKKGAQKKFALKKGAQKKFAMKKGAQKKFTLKKGAQKKFKKRQGPPEKKFKKKQGAVKKFKKNQEAKKKFKKNQEAKKKFEKKQCVKITFKLFLDDYPEDTTWKITSSDKNVLMTGGDYKYKKKHVIMKCVEPGCYTFEIEDSFGDGLALGGKYSLYYKDTTVKENGIKFGKKETIKFGDC